MEEDQPDIRLGQASLSFEALETSPASVDYDFARPLDIHVWSDSKEADQLVKRVSDITYPDGTLTRFDHKHLKVLILDLYSAWQEHPDLKLSVSLRVGDYKARNNRYNALGISRKMVEIVHLLVDCGLIEMTKGFNDRRAGGRAFRSRIWPSPRLVRLFAGSALDRYAVGRAVNEEVIVLRNSDGQEIDYTDTPDTVAMRELVREYNTLLSTMFIDIRRLDHPWIELKDGTKLTIGRHRQHAYRVFNRSDFSKGGRWFGPWWQQCPKKWRREIFINDAPTIEQDYSSLHIALLYAKRGVNFYESFEGDAYQLPTPSFLSSQKVTRKYCKLLLLMAVNAASDKEAFSAIRSSRKDDADTVGCRLKDAQLTVLLDGLRAKHPIIADDLGSDAGIDLMNLDGQITEHVVKRFTARGMPVLTVHDSYITHWGQAQFLNNVLTEAYEKVTGFKSIVAPTSGVVMDDSASWETDRLPEAAMQRSNGYTKRLIDWMAYRNELEHGEEGTPVEEV